MNRRLTIMLIALAAFAGLYFYDRDNSSEMVLPGTVISVESHSADEGADTWLITVDIDGTSLTLNPLSARPDISAGDTLCVSRIKRTGQPDEYRRATGAASC